MSPPLPRLARELIHEHVHSVGELELLLLLHRGRSRSWSPGEICTELGCPPRWAVLHLDAMADAGLVDSERDRWRFRPVSAELAAATASLAGAYRKNPREVVRFVFGAPPGLLDDRPPRPLSP